MDANRIKPRPGQESVWDYPRPPRWETVSKQIRVVVNGISIVDSGNAKRVLETSHPPVYYIPPEDIRMDLMAASERQTWCEWKGWACYFDIVLNERRIPSAAWAYSSPTHSFEPIRNHLAFYPHLMDACYVGEEQVQAQAGGFYGGWITNNIVGPFKGEPGTKGW